MIQIRNPIEVSKSRMKKAVKNRLYRDVEFLTTIRPYRNYQNLEALEAASKYISDQFSSCGYAIEEQKWRAEGNEYKNIIASWRKEKSRRLIIGAHYDVAGDQPGADDNASAVAGLLETARLVSENHPELDYGIDFVAYNLEEAPFFTTKEMGSYIHAKSVYDQQADVVGMICYEMIGYFSDKPGSQKFPLPELAKVYPDTGNYIVVVGIEKSKAFNETIHSLMSEQSGINVEKIVFPDGNGLAGRSDQRNYWAFEYDAVMISDTSFLRNPNYHKESDTIETLDFEKMTEVVNACYHAATKLG
jgi:hypothetical protein